MNDYKERFEKWQREAKERFEDFDKQIGFKEKLEEGAKVIKDTAQKGAEVLREGAEKIKTEAEKSEVGKQAVNVAEGAIKTAGETAKNPPQADHPEVRFRGGACAGFRRRIGEYPMPPRVLALVIQSVPATFERHLDYGGT